MKKIKSKVIIILALIVLINGLLSAVPSGERLRVLAEKGSMLIGYEAPTNFDTMSDASTFNEIAKTEFNIVTCENAMKMDALQPSQGNFNFGPADRLLDFALQNGIAMHGHTLVWHSQSPNWIKSLGRSQMISAMNNHIDTVLNHYKGKILVWDVVNEAFNENGTYRSSFWLNTIGQEFIDLAFQRARQADPSTKLIYNDYNIAEINAKSTAVYNMAKSMLQRGIPIDGVGFQSHLTINGINSQSYRDNLARFAELGLEIYITELDVRINPSPSQSELQTQAAIYRTMIQGAMAQPAVKAFQIWGITDKYTWVPATFPGTGAPLIFDSNYNPKPAYYALQEELEKIAPVSTPVPQQSPVWSGGPYTLDGVSDFIDIPSGLTTDLDDISIACWVKLDTIDDWSRVFDFGGNTTRFMMLTPSAGSTGMPNFTITTSGTSGEQIVESSIALTTGSWNHIAVVKKGTEAVLYINKQVAGRNSSMTIKPANLGDTSNSFIGRSQWENDPYLDGDVAKFVVYNRAITTAEVTALGNDTPDGGTLLRGDANGDGVINIVDALAIAQYSVGLEPPGFVPENADINCDGNINIVDALRLAQYYVQIVQSLEC